MPVPATVQMTPSTMHESAVGVGVAADVGVVLGLDVTAEVGVTGQPLSVALTAATRSDTVTRPDPVGSAAIHCEKATLPRRMSTPRISSLTVTTPSPLQSHGQAWTTGERATNQAATISRVIRWRMDSLRRSADGPAQSSEPGAAGPTGRARRRPSRVPR